jgi:hypothetical protein
MALYRGGEEPLAGNEDAALWNQDQQQDQDQGAQEPSERIPKPRRRNLLDQDCPTS